MADTTLQAGDLFKAGRLEEALAAANAAVKAAPTDLGRRVLLAELLLASGNLERADVILDAAGQLDPSAATVVPNSMSAMNLLLFSSLGMLVAGSITAVWVSVGSMLVST